MKAPKTHDWKRLLALLALVGSLAVTGTVLGSDRVGLEITPELTARWWQWVYSIPSSVHPLTLKETADPTGASYCMVGQEGREWFLGGIFKTVDVSPASIQTQSEGNGGVMLVEITRECHDIPLGKTILIPVLNAECNTAGELALKNDVPPDLLGKTLYLRNCAETIAEAVVEDTAAAYFGPVDSRDRWTQNPVAVKRVHTVLPFSITYAPDNVFSRDCGDPEKAFLCVPDPNPSLTQADGYWAHVRPLQPGTYKLQTFGEAPQFDFALRVTYTLTVVGPKGQ